MDHPWASGLIVKPKSFSKKANAAVIHAIGSKLNVYMYDVIMGDYLWKLIL